MLFSIKKFPRKEIFLKFKLTMKFVFINVLFNGDVKEPEHGRAFPGAVCSAVREWFPPSAGAVRSLKNEESSQRPIQGKSIDLPPQPSDDGLTRLLPEASDGKISAKFPFATYWNATGSCSVLRCQPQSPGAARAVPHRGERPEKKSTVHCP